MTGVQTCALPISNDTGFPYSNALTGAAFAYGTDNKKQINHARYATYEFYLQDTWKVNRRLTLDYGIRVQSIGQEYSKGANLGFFNASAADGAPAEVKVTVATESLDGEPRAATGTLTEQQTISTLPADFTKPSYCADLKITPNGRFLFGTNRGHDSIAAYRIGDDGRLTLLGIEPSLGKGPQNLLITPDGGLLLCANMPGNNLAVFRIDAQGGIKSVGEPLAVTSPSCIRLLP